MTEEKALYIDHLSYSSINLYLSCPMAWKYKYIDKLPTFASPALAFGSAIHNAVEGYIGGEYDNLGDGWSKHWEEFSNQENIFWGPAGDNQNDLGMMGANMLTHPDIVEEFAAIKSNHSQEPQDVERFVELSIPGVKVPIVGYIDLITKDGIPWDIKTSARSWSTGRAETELQPLFYLAALSQAGHQVPDWRFRHIVLVKTKTPKVQIFERVRTQDEVFWMLNMALHVWQAIEREAYFENPTGWKCSPKYCDFWAQCKG